MRRWEKLEVAKTAPFDLRATLLGLGPPPSAPTSKAEQRSSGGWVIRPIAGDLDWDAAEEDTWVMARGEDAARDAPGGGATTRSSCPVPLGRRGLLLFGAFFVALGVLLGALLGGFSLEAAAAALHAGCDQSPPPAPPPPVLPPAPPAAPPPPAPPGFPGQPTPLSSHLHGTQAEPSPVMRQPAPSPQSVEASQLMRLQNHWS